MKPKLDTSSKEVLAWLKATGTKSARDAMARYGIVAKDACGVPMSTLLEKATEITRWRVRKNFQVRVMPGGC